MGEKPNGKTVAGESKQGTFKQESFLVPEEHKVRRKIIRQDRIPVPPGKCFIIIDHQKFEVINISSFGLAAIFLNKDYVAIKTRLESSKLIQGSFIFGDILTQTLDLRVVRTENHPQSVFDEKVVAFEVVSEALNVDRIKALEMGGSITAEGDLQVADGKQNSTMTMEVAGSKMEMISVGGKTYMKSPMFAGGTKWVSMDSATAGDAGAPDVNTFDPETMAKALGDQDITVTAKDGGNTTVKMDLNMANLIEAMGDAGDSLGSATASMPKSIPVTYTLDSEGRPVETVMNMGMEIKVTYSDWGKKVSIEAPPASEVTTM